MRIEWVGILTVTIVHAIGGVSNVDAGEMKREVDFVDKIVEKAKEEECMIQILSEIGESGGFRGSYDNIVKTVAVRLTECLVGKVPDVCKRIDEGETVDQCIAELSNIPSLWIAFTGFLGQADSSVHRHMESYRNIEVLEEYRGVICRLGEHLEKVVTAQDLWNQDMQRMKEEMRRLLEESEERREDEHSKVSGGSDDGHGNVGGGGGGSYTSTVSLMKIGVLCVAVGLSAGYCLGKSRDPGPGPGPDLDLDLACTLNHVFASAQAAQHSAGGCDRRDRRRSGNGHRWEAQLLQRGLAVAVGSAVGLGVCRVIGRCVLGVPGTSTMH